MTSQILPITNHQTPNAHSSTITMLLKYDDEENPTTSLLHSSSFKNNNMSIKPLLPRSSSFNSSINNNSIGAVPNFFQKTRRRVASEDSLAYVSNDSSHRSSFGNDVRHAASETFLLTRLGLKMLTYLGYELSILDSVYVYLCDLNLKLKFVLFMYFATFELTM